MAALFFIGLFWARADPRLTQDLQAFYMVNGGKLGRRVYYGVIVHVRIKNGLKISVEQFTIRELENSAGKQQDFRNGGGLWEKLVKSGSYANSWW